MQVVWGLFIFSCFSSGWKRRTHTRTIFGFPLGVGMAEKLCARSFYSRRSREKHQIKRESMTRWKSGKAEKLKTRDVAISIHQFSWLRPHLGQ